MNLYDQTKMT